MKNERRKVAYCVAGLNTPKPMNFTMNSFIKHKLRIKIYFVNLTIIIYLNKLNLMKKCYLGLILSCLSMIVFSQNEIWKTESKGGINWYQISLGGEIIAGTPQGLIGIHPDNGTILYTINAIHAPTESEVSAIPNTPFSMITRTEGKLQTKVIFKNSNGAVLFDSKKENIVIGRQYLLGSTGDILIQGLKGMESVFALIDVSTGTLRWQQMNLFGKSIFAEVIDGAPIENGPDSFIIATTGGTSGGGIYCFSAQDGSQKWKANLPTTKGAQTVTKTESKLVTSFFEKDKFIYMKGQNIMAYQIQTGEMIWKEAAKQKGLPDLVVYDPVGLIVASAVDPNNNLMKPTISMYQYNTGENLWPEPLKLMGTIKKYKYCEKGIIVSMDNGQGSQLINIVDLENGQYVFEKSYKISGVTQELALNNGTLYVRTNIEEDFIDMNGGKSILEKNISSSMDQPLLNIRKDQISYTYNPKNKMLYVSDLNLSTQKTFISTPIAFEQKEIPTKMEWGQKGIVLSSSQTVCAYNQDGALSFQTHIPAPGISGWKKALYTTSAALNTMDAMRYGELEVAAKQASAQSKNPKERELCDAIGQLGNQGAAVRMNAAAQDMEQIKKRFKASADGNDIQFILGKLDNGNYGIFGISKINGEKIVTVDFGKDKEPKYLLDDAGKRLYYQKDNEHIHAYTY
jgi:outer membrane protein assembly factor BamB